MNVSKKYLIVIGGPTGIGKTKLAHILSNEYKAPIVSADSRQLYQEMTIGTARPTKTEVERYQYHMIANHSIHHSISVGEYERLVSKLLVEVYSLKDIVILCGGSGLYINAVLFGIDDFPNVPWEITEKWNNHFQEYGLKSLQENLDKLDPEYSANVDLKNPRRIIRALGIIEVSGKPYSSFLSGKTKKRNFEIIPLLLEIDRADLYKKINQRVDQMIEDGLVEEAKKLYPYKSLKSLQTVGYQELFEYFDGNSTLKEATDKIKQNSRRYAKRQMTWFNRYPEWPRFEPNSTDLILEYIKSTIKMA